MPPKKVPKDAYRKSVPAMNSTPLFDKSQHQIGEKIAQSNLIHKYLMHFGDKLMIDGLQCSTRE